MKVNCMRCYLAVYVICIYVFHTHDYTATVTSCHSFKYESQRERRGRDRFNIILFDVSFKNTEANKIFSGGY